jgi:hypothetical protein
MREETSDLRRIETLKLDKERASLVENDLFGRRESREDKF